MKRSAVITCRHYTPIPINNVSSSGVFRVLYWRRRVQLTTKPAPAVTRRTRMMTMTKVMIESTRNNTTRRDSRPLMWVHNTYVYILDFLNTCLSQILQLSTLLYTVSIIIQNRIKCLHVDNCNNLFSFINRVFNVTLSSISKTISIVTYSNAKL